MTYTKVKETEKSYSIRIPFDLWLKATQMGKESGRPLFRIILDALEEYTKGNQ